MQKNLSEITRSEWIALNWYEPDPVMGPGSPDDRVFMADSKRTPNEAAEAALDWDSTAHEREELSDVEL